MGDGWGADARSWGVEARSWSVAGVLRPADVYPITSSCFRFIFPLSPPIQGRATLAMRVQVKDTPEGPQTANLTIVLDVGRKGL